MDLNYRYFGNEGKPPLVILHGLLGSSRNWQMVGKVLSKQFEVFAVDLRNHGDSPHLDGMDFASLGADLESFAAARGLRRFHLMGHSLGGKVAMYFAAHHPKQVESLIVVDIAPREYEPYHVEDFAAMKALDLSAIESRQEADEALSKQVPDWGMRQFLLTNLKRLPDNGFVWGVNLKALMEARDAMRAAPLRKGETYGGPVCFVLGGKSDFVRKSDHALIRQHFPESVIKTLPDAGHNPHTENREVFVPVLQEWVNAGKI